MYNPEWEEIFWELRELKSKRFKRFSHIEKSKREKKVVYDWAFVFSGLSFLLWLGLPDKGLHSSLYALRIVLTWAAVVFIWGSLMLKNRIRDYEKLTSQIYELEEKLERTPQKKS